MTDREIMRQALDALELLARCEHPLTKIQVRKPRDGGSIVTVYPHQVATDAAEPLRERLAQPLRTHWEGCEEVHPECRKPRREWVACKTLCELCVKRGYTFCANAVKTTPINTPPQRKPLIDSVRQMRDVQGMDGTWNYDPYMHGLYNGLEFAVSLLEQREPQFKDAPEKWLSDLPKPRIFSATEAAHGIGEKK